MRYLILIFLFYSCSNNTESQSIGSRNKNFIDSLLKISNGARVEFDHSSKMVSIVARKITSRKGLDSLSAFIGTPTADTTCLKPGLFNSYGRISLFRDTAMIDRIQDIDFVLQNHCEGLYIETGEGLQQFQMTAVGKSTLLSLKHESSAFLDN